MTKKKNMQRNERQYFLSNNIEKKTNFKKSNTKLNTVFIPNLQKRAYKKQNGIQTMLCLVKSTNSKWKGRDIFFFFFFKRMQKKNLLFIKQCEKGGGGGEEIKHLGFGTKSTESWQIEHHMKALWYSILNWLSH